MKARVRRRGSALGLPGTSLSLGALLAPPLPALPDPMGTVEPCDPCGTSALGGQMRVLVCPLGPGFQSLRLSNWNFSWICFDSWDWVSQYPLFFYFLFYLHSVRSSD